MDAFRRQPADIVMRRPDLAGMPAIGLAPGYALRPFRRGDEAAWAALLAAAFPELPSPQDIPAKEFLHDPVWRPQRVRFACRDDVPVACAAAWETPDLWGTRTGRLHWVAAHPAHAGRGLGRAVVLAALHWMARRYDCAVLVTQTFRLPAIRLYLALGFGPDLEAFPEMAGRWADVEAGMGRI